MERIAVILGALIVLAICGLIAFNFWSDPTGVRREELELTLAVIEPIEVEFESPDWDFDGWQGSVAAKPSLWQELIEPPPPPPPPPEKPPNIAAKLKGVTAGTRKIGKTVIIKSRSDPKGTYLGVGDVVGGCTIKEITRGSVIFSLTWKGQELLHEIPRQ